MAFDDLREGIPELGVVRDDGLVLTIMIHTHPNLNTLRFEVLE